MKWIQPLLRIRDLTEDQWGLVTRRQIENADIGATTIDRMTHTGGTLERVTYGVYHIVGTPTPDHLELRAAWLQLAPEVPAWNRTADQGIVSHRSAASLYGLGNLPPDHHEFTVPKRRQVRRSDVRIHVRPIPNNEYVTSRLLPLTRPSRIATDLLRDHEDPEAVALIIVEALRRGMDDPGMFAVSLSPFARRFGLQIGDGMGLLRWLTGLVEDPATDRWLNEAQAHVDRITIPPNEIQGTES